MHEAQKKSNDGGPNATVRMQITPTAARPEVNGGPKTVRITPGADADASVPQSTGESLFNQYAVVSRIGDGGMGVVYLARDRRLNRFVAIKRLNRRAQGISSLRQRFLQEARAVAALNHSYIVHIYALGEDDDGPYIVMEYVAGPNGAVTRARQEAADNSLPLPAPPLTLDNQTSRNGQMSVTDAIALLVKVSRAVVYAHESGVIHRDLKPSNILLDKTGEPKIVDFGLARLMRVAESKLTAPGEKLLSLGYGAPEQEQDASLSDERSDVYGLGAILYFAITGQNPRYFREQDIPVALRDVLVKALATDREQRWPTAAAFTEALHAVQNKTKVETPTVKTTWRCKWCDTVNPLTIRYCAECGWDGGVTCPECNADTFAGVQYCGNCGADARAYESITHLRDRVQAANERRQFERALAFAGRAHGFEPAGPGGRRLVKEIHDEREQAERAITHREQLKDMVPIEMKAENYERALTFIKEYRDLSSDALAFNDDERQIPGLTRRRDLARAERCIRNSDWHTAKQICQTLLETVAPQDAACLALLRRIRLRRWAWRMVQYAAGVLALIVVYVLSLAPVATHEAVRRQGPLRRFYNVAIRLHMQGGVLSPVLKAYAGLWGVHSFDVAKGLPDTPAVLSPSAELPELADLQQAFIQQLNELAGEQRRFAAAWPEEYQRELTHLSERRQAAGDYAGVIATQSELHQFQGTRKIGLSPEGEFDELMALKKKYRQSLAEQKIGRERKRVALSRKYAHDLEGLLRTHTREGRLEVAAVINEAIKREKTSQDLLDAEAALASLPTGTTESTPKVVGVTPSAAGLNEMQVMRQTLDTKLAELEAAYETQRTQWPDQYSVALMRQMEQFQKAGEFDHWTRTNEEHERFLLDRQLAMEHVVDEPEALRLLQKRHIDLLYEVGKRRADAVRMLFDGHCTKLEEWKRRLTRAGDMDLAAAVNAEIQQLKARQVYLTALQKLTPDTVTEGSAPAASPVVE